MTSRRPHHVLRSVRVCLSGIVAVVLLSLLASCVSLSPSDGLAPGVPAIAGDTTASVGDTCLFLAWSLDPEGDSIAYSFDVDAVRIPPWPLWTSYVPSGDSMALLVVFSYAGTHRVSVEAKDPYENRSVSSSLAVIVK